jgi:hypothetical protein
VSLYERTGPGMNECLSLCSTILAIYVSTGCSNYSHCINICAACVYSTSVHRLSNYPDCREIYMYTLLQLKICPQFTQIIPTTETSTYIKSSTLVLLSIGYSNYPQLYILNYTGHLSTVHSTYPDSSDFHTPQHWEICLQLT